MLITNQIQVNKYKFKINSFYKILLRMAEELCLGKNLKLMKMNEKQ